LSLIGSARVFITTRLVGWQTLFDGYSKNTYFWIKRDMMKNVLILLIVGIVLIVAGCGNPSNNNKSQNPSDVQALPDMHNARIALDYTGTYKGTVPCADCGGIETTLTLTTEGEYRLQTVYKGKSDQVFEKSGTYTWNDSGNTVILDRLEHAPNQYFVGENMLIQLDMEGNRITGELGERYILRKFE
jgi:uncharacterized lipoprotein NlpE involved in copper resistance